MLRLGLRLWFIQGRIGFRVCIWVGLVIGLFLGLGLPPGLLLALGLGLRHELGLGLELR